MNEIVWLNKCGWVGAVMATHQSGQNGLPYSSPIRPKWASLFLTNPAKMGFLIPHQSGQNGLPYSSPIRPKWASLLPTLRSHPQRKTTVRVGKSRLLPLSEVLRGETKKALGILLVFRIGANCTSLNGSVTKLRW